MFEWRTTIAGDLYHQKKPEFHTLLKKYKFVWKGKIPAFRWNGIGQAVVAKFERDGDVTVSATIMWFGTSETEFLNKLKELFE